MNNFKSIIEEFSDEQLENIKQKYITPELKAFFEREEYIQTFESYFDSAMNISEAAKNAFMHRNTLNYRINKFEAATGFDIRKFDDAFCLKFLIEIYKKDSNKEQIIV